MKLKDCFLNSDLIFSEKRILNSPEEDWIKARDSQLIPENLFNFYCVSDYFSVEKAPKFLKDENRYLFSFLRAIIFGCKESFETISESIQEIVELQKVAYNPIKKSKGESFDLKASQKIDRLFKLILVDTYGLYDQLAEIIAIFFGDILSFNKVGKSMFSNIHKKLVLTEFKPSKIVRVKETYIEEINSVLKKYFLKQDFQKDWYKVLSLLRNKIAHLGGMMFPKFCFHDENEVFYTFLPNKWPFIFEKDFSLNQEKSGANIDIANYFKNNLIKCDLVELIQGQKEQVFQIYNEVFKLICRAYAEFRNYDLFQYAVSQLNENMQTFDFENF